MDSIDIKIENLINQWYSDPEVKKQIAYHLQQPEFPGEFFDFPDCLSSLVVDSFLENGFSSLFSHQKQCFDMVTKGDNVLLNTGTASGKTLAYLLPILNKKISAEEQSTALFIYPTKALANDQMTFFNKMIQPIIDKKKNLRGKLVTGIYDGDTPKNLRSSIRKKANFLLTNPDMLHYAILPYHTNWDQFLASLNFIIIDEIHQYRGVFGSHITNILRRLYRVLSLYQANPQIICTSATIGNPLEFVEKLTEKKFSVIDNNGAPRGKKDLFLFNPPVINQQLGIRKSPQQTAVEMVGEIIRHDFQTLVFQVSRKSVEFSLKHFLEFDKKYFNQVQSYRSGYLPQERRMLEENLRSGKIKALFTTNALELGIDIGSLNSVLIAGYPGSVASTLQQMGRAGRKKERSFAAVIADSNPIDQYLVKNPEYIFSKSPENALLNPNNPLILFYHLKCAAHELLFKVGDSFGSVPWEVIAPYLKIFEEDQFVHHSDERYFWISNQYPAAEFSIRNTGGNLVTLHEIIGDNNLEAQVIGQVDYPSSLWMVHPGAVYIHRGENYLVKSLDLENSRALLEKKVTNYYTEPKRDTQITIADVIEERKFGHENIFLGEIEVDTNIKGFKEILWESRQTVCEKDLDLPHQILQTEAMWLVINQNTIEDLTRENLWKSSPNDYGPNWEKIRISVRTRDQFRCQLCGAPENGKQHHVHHITPFKAFIDIGQANKLDNLTTLCSSCHKKVEETVKVKTGLSGLSYLFRYFSPLFLMCDVEDIGVYAESQAAFAEGLPVCMLYDTVPMGIGLSRHFFTIFGTFLSEAEKLVNHCECEDGCPACVGPVAENGIGSKKETLALINLLVKNYGSQTY